MRATPGSSSSWRRPCATTASHRTSTSWWRWAAGRARYQTLIEGKLHATLLTPPFVGAALERGCHVIARGEEMAPVYQATVGLAKRSWAEGNRTQLVNYIRCYVDATEWCFAPENRRHCLDLLARHNGLTGAAAEETLDSLLDPKHGLYPKAALNVPGIAAALELRAGMGFIASPAPTPSEIHRRFLLRGGGLLSHTGGKRCTRAHLTSTALQRL